MTLLKQSLGAQSFMSLIAIAHRQFHLAFNEVQ